MHKDLVQLSVAAMQLVGLLHMHKRYCYMPKSKGLLEILGRFMLVQGSFWPGITEKWSKCEQMFRVSRILSSSGSNRNFV